jgi:hypothetical protein
VPNICDVWQHILVWTIVLTREVRSELLNVTINRYTFVINKESGINSNFKPNINKLNTKDPAVWKILFLYMRGTGIVPDWSVKFGFSFEFKFVSSRCCILFMVLCCLVTLLILFPNFEAQTVILSAHCCMLASTEFDVWCPLTQKWIKHDFCPNGLMDSQFWSLDWHKSWTVKFVLIFVHS